MKTDRTLVAILAVALALRLGAVLWLSDTVPHSDAAYYHLAAQKMAADWKFPFDRSQVEFYGKLGWWPPLYPAFLSLLYRLFGVHHRVAVFVQAVLGTLVVGLVHRIAKRAGGRSTANIAASLVAIDPTYIFLTNILASENLFVAWMCLGLWWAGPAWTSPSRRFAVLGGIAFGLGALTRAIGLLVPFVTVAAARPRAASRRAWLVTAAWLVGGSALTIAPWTLRNALVAGSPALVCFGGGLNFYYGHNPQATGYRPLEQTPMAALRTQADIDREGYRLGLANLAHSPFGFVSRGVRKVGSLFGSPGYAPHSNSAILLPNGWQTDPNAAQQATALRQRQRAKNVYLDGLYTRLATLHTWLLLVGAALALMRWRRLPAELRLAVWLCAAWIAAHVVFWAQPRFRYPMEIPLALLAGWAFAGLRAARARRAGAVAALVAMLGAGCAAPPPPIPPLEAWGRADQPYDDPLEAAAMKALGPRPAGYEVTNPAPIRLGEFLVLERRARDLRAGIAADLVSQGDTWRRTSGVDSLPPYLEAIRVDPSCTRAYQRAAQMTLVQGAVERAHALAAQGLRLDPQDAQLWVVLSEAYQREGDPNRARRALEYALALDPALDASAYQALASFYLRTGDLVRADSLLRTGPARLLCRTAGVLDWGARPHCGRHRGGAACIRRSRA